MTTPQQAYELANTHDDYTADCLRSLADQLDAALEDRVALAMRVEALTQNLDGHKTQAAEDFALISRLTAERDKAIAFAQSAWSRGNASGYASNEQAMRKMEDAMLSERLDSNVTNEMLTDAVERAEAERDQAIKAGHSAVEMCGKLINECNALRVERDSLKTDSPPEASAIKPTLTR